MAYEAHTRGRGEIFENHRKNHSRLKRAGILAKRRGKLQSTHFIGRAPLTATRNATKSGESNKATTTAHFYFNTKFFSQEGRRDAQITRGTNASAFCIA